MDTNFLNCAIKQFAYYRMLGDKAMQQVPDEKLNWQYNPESNSIAVIVKHLHGNMISRFTDFLHSDGEKEWRNRDAEFKETMLSRDEILQCWNTGWDLLLATLDSLSEADLFKTVYIRNMGHTVVEAVNRQLAHYPYHVGQLIFLSKMIAAENWKSLSIPRGTSAEFNADKFGQPKRTQHFTDEYLKR
jgi:hypothetical protein